MDEDIERLISEYPDRKGVSKSKYRYEFAAKLLKQYCGEGTVVDAGAQPYYFSISLQQKGYDVIALNKDLSYHREIHQEHNIDVRECDLERGPVPVNEGSVDAVVLMEVFEHLRINPIATLERIQEIIRPGGYLIMSTPNLYYLANIISFCSGNGIKTQDDVQKAFKLYEDRGFPGHVRNYSESELRDIFEYCGFDVEQVSYHDDGSYGSMKQRLARHLLKPFPKLQKSIYLVGKKRVR